MKFIIWGAGARGQRLYWHLGAEKIEAYIDSDEKKSENRLLKRE